MIWLPQSIEDTGLEGSSCCAFVGTEMSTIHSTAADQQNAMRNKWQHCALIITK